MFNTGADLSAFTPVIDTKPNKNQLRALQHISAVQLANCGLSETNARIHEKAAKRRATSRKAAATWLKRKRGDDGTVQREDEQDDIDEFPQHLLGIALALDDGESIQKKTKSKSLCKSGSAKHPTKKKRRVRKMESLSLPPGTTSSVSDPSPPSPPSRVAAKRKREADTLMNSPGESDTLPFEPTLAAATTAGVVNDDVATKRDEDAAKLKSVIMPATMNEMAAANAASAETVSAKTSNVPKNTTIGGTFITRRGRAWCRMPTGSAHPHATDPLPPMPPTFVPPVQKAPEKDTVQHPDFTDSLSPEMQTILAAIRGNSPAAVEMRKSLMSTEFDESLTGIDAKKWQEKQGTVVHNPTNAQIPLLRPVIESETELSGEAMENVDIGVLNILTRKPKYKAHELWLMGVTREGVSTSFKLTGFEPSFDIVADKPYSRAQCAALANDLNARVSSMKFGSDPKSGGGGGGGAQQSRFKSRGKWSSSSSYTKQSRNQQQQQPDVKGTPAVTRIVASLRTPCVGFTYMRKDTVLRVYLRNEDVKNAIVATVKRMRMRVINDTIDAADQLIHRSIPERKAGETVDDDVDYDGAIAIGQWVSIPRSMLTTIVPGASRVTTSQYEGAVKWTHVTRSKRADIVPVLTASWDMECISQEAYELGIDKFPDANFVRDQVICHVVSFYVNGYSKESAFLRVGVAVGQINPAPPGVYVLSVDTELQALQLVRKLIVMASDADNITGWNTIFFDLPYVAKRGLVIHHDRDFLKWGRFKRDECYAPDGWEPEQGRKRRKFNTGGKGKGGGDGGDGDDGDGDDGDGDGGGRKSTEKITSPGRWQGDLLHIVRKLPQKYGDYSLRGICNEMLRSKANKTDMAYENIAPYFYDTNPAKRTEVLMYCVFDTLLPILLDLQNMLTNSSIAVSTLTNTPMQKVVEGGQQVRVFQALNADIDYYGWYNNAYIMKESECYSEPIPDDWNGWCDNNPVRQMLAMAIDRGQIEPGEGYEPGDERALARDAAWKRVLLVNYMCTRPDVKRSMAAAITAKLGADKVGGQTQDQILRHVEVDLLTSGHAREFNLFCAKMMRRTKPAKSNATKKREKMDGKTAKHKKEPSPAVNAAKRAVKRAEKRAADRLLTPAQRDAQAAEDRKRGQLSIKDLCNGVVGVQKREERNVHLMLGDPKRGRRWYKGDVKLTAAASQGGHVFRPLKGMWQMLISTLDFKSLYPSIMQADNIGYATLVWEEKYLNLPGVTYMRVPHGNVCYVFAIAEPNKLNSEEYEAAKKAGIPIERPITRTLMPRILRRFVTARARVKALKKAAVKAGKVFLAKVLDCAQLALKLTCNASYGFCNAPEKIAYLACPPLAHSVCSIGRDSIQLVKYIVEYIMGGIVVYGDTDSVMAVFPWLDYERVDGDDDATRANYIAAHKAACKEVCDMCNEFFSEPHELEDEDTVTTAMYCKRKNYLNVNLAGEYCIKGMESKRRNYSMAIRKVLKKIEVCVLNARPEEAIEHTRDYITKLADNKVPLDELKISIAYNPKTRTNAAIAPHTFEKERMRTNATFLEGNRMFYIVRKLRANERKFQQGEEVKYATKMGMRVDVDHYAKEGVAPITKLLCPLVNTNALFRQLRAVAKKDTTIASTHFSTADIVDGDGGEKNESSSWDKLNDGGPSRATTDENSDDGDFGYESDDAEYDD